MENLSTRLKTEQELNSGVGYRDQDQGYTAGKVWLPLSAAVRIVNLSQTS